ncbi:hypothetical protein CC85DRAFT_283557 [Cutaneotrichosporon oleaginosum]|uniref:F-box domain-containing protein n=1 Tax=Cutaneotrichosporon oleaginosum TaxID=879819 RepID=A0A0J0XT94_9TREE|nr:uncharacterized protein CC85DRAFT_283557 [Cutaneotrichosporon oleaginosum]KLT44313.1 hypothetical protein CC85DRAFT_283557 [Cutaneotrichosporon oleaginosum]TXT07959.1 hypothetical protein COLE_04883 [Cutaneotrichosporon oleaginosum]
MPHSPTPHTALAASLVAFAAPADLPALRAVSRTFREAADKRIFAHVLLLELDGDIEVRDAQGRRLPGVHWELKVTPEERDVWISRLKHARVVDYYDDVDLSKDPVLAAALSNACTARRLRGGRGLAPHTLLDTLQLGYDDAQGDGYDSDDDTPAGSIEHVPPTVRDLTVCVRFDAQHHRLSEAGYTLSLPPLDSLTVVFAEELFSRIPSRCWSRGSCWSPRRTSLQNSPHPLPRWGFLRPLVRQLAAVRSPITLVGLESIPRALVGLPVNMGVEDVRRDFADSVLVHVPPAAQEPALSFLTMDEYRACVGDEAFALATSRPGPPPSLPSTSDLSDDEEWEEQRMSKTQRNEWEKLVRTAARSLIRSCLLY